MVSNTCCCLTLVHGVCTACSGRFRNLKREGRLESLGTKPPAGCSGGVTEKPPENDVLHAQAPVAEQFCLSDSTLTPIFPHICNFIHFVARLTVPVKTWKGCCNPAVQLSWVRLACQALISTLTHHRLWMTSAVLMSLHSIHFPLLFFYLLKTF